MLSLGRKGDAEAFLEAALPMVMEISRATRGYLELRDPAEPDRCWSLASGFSGEELAGVRRRISGGIIARALATGETVHTASALLDPLFHANESVRAHGISAVMCAPVGEPPHPGVVYLERDADGGGFPEEDRLLTETFARGMAGPAECLLRTVSHVDPDPVSPWRDALGAHRFVGRSPALAAVLKQVVHLAPLDVTVFLTGPTGSGKSALARLLHEASGRRTRPFVEMNCAALPPDLVESELFGAHRGAHSTAHETRPGRVAAAEGGTLFLDEVTELPQAAQAKLLQLLHDGTYFPLGAAQAQRANLRVIAATNVDPHAATKAGTFRGDLYWRLMVMPLVVPALADRTEDIPALVRLFAAEAVQRHRLPATECGPAAQFAASAAVWEGNVRQLGHAVEAAVIRAASEGCRVVTPRHLFPDVPDDGKQWPTWQDAVRQQQTDFLRRSLDTHGWNVAETARALDMARSRLYELMAALGVSR
jgi:Nif-specific regulatory protein